MKTRVLLICALALTLLGAAGGRQQQRPAPPPDEEVVRITTNLVQVDVVVTDKNGQQVTDLQPTDFELLEDGRPQQITHFAYVNTTPAPVAGIAAAANAPAVRDNETPAPPAPLDPRRARRTIALVVDDLGMSFESVPPLRETLRRFVAGMSPDDLAAIIRTGGDVGAL
jgi:VWFA-related protein